MDLRVLGPVEVRRANGELIALAPRVHALLVVLLLHLGEKVSDKQIKDFVWDGEEPVKNTISRYVTKLRAVVRDLDPAAKLVRAGGLLSLTLSCPDVVDLYRLERHLKAADAAGQPEVVLAELAAATAEFRGEPWAGLSGGAQLEAERNSLVKRWKKAHHRRIQLLTTLGRGTEAADELDGCRRRWPHDEQFQPRASSDGTADAGVGLTPLLFEPDYVLGPEPLPSALLQAEYRVVGFDEVDDHLSRLKAWLNGSDTVDLRLITGPGGRGKTRLAHELVRFAGRTGWTAGLVREDAPPSALDQVLAEATPVLLVIDYAEGRASEVTAVVRAVLARTTKARILLLARSVGVLPTTVRRDKDARIAKLLTKMVVEPVRSLPAGQGARRRWFDQAVRAFTPHLTRIPTGEVHPPADLDDERYDRMLDVHAAALAAVLDAISGWSSTRTDPLDRVLDHERRYWLRSIKAHGIAQATTRRLNAVISVATLCGAATPEDADRLLGSLRTFQGKPTELIDTYADWAGALYPGPAALNPLRPDRLGEDLVVEFLGTRAAVASLAGVLNEGQVLRAITVLARASSRHDGVLQHLLGLIEPDKVHRLPVAVAVASQVESPQLVEAITELTGSDTALTEVVMDRLPHRSLALSVFAAAQTKVLLQLQLRHEHVDNEFVAEVRQNLALRLLDVGEFDEALALAGQAVEGYRAFVRPTLDDQVALAVSLDTLATAYAKLGMHTEGIAAATEAVELLEQLLEGGQPGRTYSRQHLKHRHASTLVNLGILLDADGAPEEALPRIERGVDELLELVHADHPGARADYANGLQSLGSCWAAIGWRKEHLAACTTAVDIVRELDAEAPDVHRGDLIGLLGTLAGAHAELGQTELGVEVGEEAVTLARDLVLRYGNAHDVLLADALTNTASLYRQTGRSEEALDHATEAVKLFRALATRQPGEHLAGLASALYNLGIDLARTGRTEDALDAYDEAAEVYRKLAGPRPDLFEPDLADALVGLADTLSDLDEESQALELADEAVELLKRAMRSETAALQEKLAAALHTASAAAFQLDDLTRAVPDAMKALEIYRNLIATRYREPDGDFVRILRHAARTVEADGQHEVAFELYQEMIALLREAVEEGGDVANELEHLAVACLNAGVCAANLEDLATTASLTAEAVEHRRALLDTEFGSVVHLAEALTNMAHTQVDLQRYHEARELAREAVTMLSTLEDDDRTSYLVSALVAQAYATIEDDERGAELLLQRAMDVAAADEDLRDEVTEASTELGFEPES
ncbi:tetratricopeptide repeat protein [Lentzea kentuckyensis]|uniref:tetratricopeptide repeat protein n=1 Tax=Lentzea kentuckyensis TaxID=360086 RepID=UPI001302E464|nr:tetratricopeptide repeat protein [Lentzea kentuckyensis]